MRRIVFVLIALILLLACGPKKQPAPPPGTAWPGKMTLTTAPAPPVFNKDTTFRLHLEDASGKPVADAGVKASLVMPLMDMGKNEVTLAGKGNGDYEGTGKFTMSGPWNVVVTASANGTTGEQTIPVVVHAP